MPVYEYKCGCNDEIVQITTSFSEYKTTYPCEKCNKEMLRHYTPAGISFKGPGFYKTDNPR
jgi:putative FmdB family regulatory protein